jgi:hypothetical protein
MSNRSLWFDGRRFIVSLIRAGHDNLNAEDELKAGKNELEEPMPVQMDEG